MKQPRIVSFDIETSPNLGYTWGKYEQTVIDFKQGWRILSFSMKVLGQKRVRTFALPDYPNYRRDKLNDEALVRDLWKMMNEADIIVAHNGDNFDVKKANARFIVYQLDPPAPYKTVDTLKIARRVAAFNSNKLDDLAAVLKIGRKLPTTGKDLWLGCMMGDMKSWRMMKRYNAHDVVLLEKVYLRLRPWAPAHPNVNLITGEPRNCKVCSSLRLIKFGTMKSFSRTRTLEKQRYRCLDCGTTMLGEYERLPRRIVMH